MTAPGTLRGVPRKPDQLPPGVMQDLLLAREAAEDAQDQYRAAVRAALEQGSVRQVAKATGLSPTTVQAWGKGESR